MLYSNLFAHTKVLVDLIAEKEAENITKAAELVAGAVANGGCFFVYDRGHLLSSELIARAGGAAFVRQLNYNVPSAALGGMAGARGACVERIDPSLRQESTRRFEDEFIRHLFITNGLTKGDVLLINSVSGRGYSATAMAKTAAELGIHIIAVSSMETCTSVVPEGGKRFIEYADVIIDNHAPHGDALFEVEGLDEKFLPASGFAAALIGWALVAESVECLLQMGIKPTIYRSVNIEGGPEQCENATKRYNEMGY